MPSPHAKPTPARNHTCRPLLARLSLPLLGLLPGCAGVPPVGDPGNRWPAGDIAHDQITWPEAYTPADATFFVHNEIEIHATPQAVWEVLIAAESWPAWYEGASNVQVTTSPHGTLHENAIMTWRTMDLDFTSTITEFKPPYRLSWESRRSLIQGYHAWLLVPTPHGVRVITDESQHGLLAVLQGIFIPNKLRRLHDVWLAALKARAEAHAEGLPDQPPRTTLLVPAP